MPRYIPPQIYNKLTSESAGVLMELWELDLSSGTRYWSVAKYTWRSQVYSPMISGRDSIASSINGIEDKTALRVINIDGSLRSVVTAGEFLDAAVRVRLIPQGLSDSTTPVLTGGGTGSLTVSLVKPKQRDGEWTFTKRNGLTTWDVVFIRHDFYKIAQVATATTGALFTSDDGNFQATINAGTYPDGSIWKLRTINNFLLCGGVSENPDEITETILSLPISGLGALLLGPVPRRNIGLPCNWVFGPVATALGKTSPCGYVGPTTTANGAGASSTTLIVNDATNLASAKGASIKIGSGASVEILTIVGTTITLAAARSWSNADPVSYTTCRKHFLDCQDRDREFEFGGFRGIRTVQGVISRRVIHGLIGRLRGMAGTLRGRQQRVLDPVPDPDSVVPIVYGRRVVDGLPVEFFAFDDNGGRSWRDVFYVICAGALPTIGGNVGAIDRHWIGGRRRDNQVRTVSGKEVLFHGCFFRNGGIALNDGETNAEYDTDSDQQVRSQNIDYQGGTGTALNRVAYAIFRAPRISELWGLEDDKPIPEGKFRILQGKSVQLYNRDGTVNGSPAFSQNPFWEILDIVTDAVNGAGVSPSRIRYSALKVHPAGTALFGAVDYSDQLIDSFEADTKATSNSSGVNVSVASSSGFKIGETLYKNGSSTGLTIVDVKFSTQITLSGTLSVTNGDRIHQKNPRFQCDIDIRERDHAYQIIESILAGCRGYWYSVDDELAFECDRPLPSEILTDGGLEVWTDASNLTNWSKIMAGTAILSREAAVIKEGTFSAKISRSGATTGVDRIFQQALVVPGAVYVYRVWMRSTVANGIGVFIARRRKVAVGSFEELQTDGTWALPTGSGILPFIIPAANVWTEFAFMFRIDPHLDWDLGATNLEVHIGSAFDPIWDAQSLYIDGASIYGPVGGEFRDIGQAIKKQRAFIQHEEADFRTEPANPLHDTNEVQIRFPASLGGSAYPAEQQEVILVDETHEASHLPKVISLDAPGLSTVDQAVRIGKHALYRARTLLEPGTFTGGLAALLPAPGDVIIISHRGPAWVRRLCRVISSTVDENCRGVEIEVEHYDPSIYTDAGEKSEVGVGAGPPTITLSVDAIKERRFDLSWIPSVGAEPIDRYEVYVDTATMSASDPPADKLVERTKTTAFKYEIPDSQRGATLYARVVGILKNGDIVVSNEVNSTEVSIDPTQTQVKGSRAIDPGFEAYRKVPIAGIQAGLNPARFWRSGNSQTVGLMLWSQVGVSPPHGIGETALALQDDTGEGTIVAEEGRGVAKNGKRLPRRFEQNGYYHTRIMTRFEGAVNCANPGDMTLKVQIIHDSGTIVLLSKALGAQADATNVEAVTSTPVQITVNPTTQAVFKLQVVLESPSFSGFDALGLLVDDLGIMPASGPSAALATYSEEPDEPAYENTAASGFDGDTSDRLGDDVKDTSGRLVKQMFKKQNIADPDDFSSIADGTAMKKAPWQAVHNLVLDGGFERASATRPARWTAQWQDGTDATSAVTVDSTDPDTSGKAVGRSSLKIAWDGSHTGIRLRQGNDQTKFPGYEARIPLDSFVTAAVSAKHSASMPSIGNGWTLRGVAASGGFNTSNLAIGPATAPTSWTRQSLNPNTKVPSSGRLSSWGLDLIFDFSSAPSAGKFSWVDNVWAVADPVGNLNVFAPGSLMPQYEFGAYAQTNDDPLGDPAHAGFYGRTSDFVPGPYGLWLPNYLVGGDFNKSANWDSAGNGTKSVNGTVADELLIGSWTSSGGKPTSFRGWPGGDSATADGARTNYRFPLPNSWVTLGLSVRKETSTTPNADLKLFTCWGTVDGTTSQADTENDFRLLRNDDGTGAQVLDEFGNVIGYDTPSGATIRASDLATTHTRFVFYFRYPSNKPDAPTGGATNKVGLRTSATNANFQVDKLMVVPGRWPLRNFPFNVAIQEIKADDYYGDNTGSHAKGGFGSGETFSADPTEGYARKKFPD